MAPEVPVSPASDIPPAKQKQLRDSVMRWISEPAKGVPPVAPVVAKLTPKPPTPPSTPPAVVATKTEVKPPPPKVAPVSMPVPKPLVVPKPKKHHRLHLLPVLWFSVLTFFVVTTVGVYALHWNNQTSNRILTFVPLPYGFVRYHPLWLGTYRAEAASLAQFHGADAIQRLPEEEVQKIIVRRALANDLAWSLGLWVSEDEIDGELQRIVAEAGSIQSVTDSIKNSWDMSLEDYRRRVLRPYLLKQKLLKELQSDPVVSREIGQTGDLQALDAYLDTIRQNTNVHLFF